MNEQIQELVDQADKWATLNYTWTPNGTDWVDMFTEKLAKLVAQQCAQVAMTQHHSTSPQEYAELDEYDKGCDDTASRISVMIRKTFGVEE